MDFSSSKGLRGKKEGTIYTVCNIPQSFCHLYKLAWFEKTVTTVGTKYTLRKYQAFICGRHHFHEALVLFSPPLYFLVYKDASFILHYLEEVEDAF